MSAREPVHRTHLIARATPAEVYAVVTDFPAYPRLFPEFKQTRVVSTTGNVVRVEFTRRGGDVGPLCAGPGV